MLGALVRGRASSRASVRMRETELQEDNSKAGNPPPELRLHADPEFVARCAHNLKRGCVRFKRLYVFRAEATRAAVSECIETPNYVLTRWAAVCFQEHPEFAEERRLPPEIQAVLSGPRGCRAACRRRRARRGGLLVLPLLQCSILLVVLMYQLLPPDGDSSQPYCMPFPSTGGVGTAEMVRGIVWFTADISIDALLYGIAVLQSTLSTREWDAIAFLTSLHWQPAANLAAYGACLVECVNSALYSATLYLIIVRADDPLSVVFNATALSFVLDIDNMWASLAPRRQQHVGDALERLGVQNATHADHVLFLCAPSEAWAPFGLHHLRPQARSGLLCVYWSAQALMWGVHILCYYLITMCHIIPVEVATGNGTSIVNQYQL
jgi:hypothetical protein